MILNFTTKETKVLPGHLIERGHMKGVLGCTKFILKQLGAGSCFIKLLDRETSIVDEINQTVSFDVNVPDYTVQDKCLVESILKRCNQSPYILSVKLKDF